MTLLTTAKADMVAGVAGRCAVGSLCGGSSHDQADIPAEQTAPQAAARVPGTHEHEGRAAGSRSPADQGTRAARRLDLLLGAMGARSKLVRLRLERHFRRLKDEGARRGTRDLVLRWYVHDEGETRAAISVGKRVGHAVVRNRLRRRLREILRLRVSGLRASCDLWLTAQATAADLSFRELEQQVEALLTRSGLWLPRVEP